MNLPWLSIDEIRNLVQRGDLGPLDVATAHLERIRRLNPELQAYVHVVDKPEAGGGGPLPAVTAGIKDTYPVAGMPWIEGSPKWRDRSATDDAIPVARLREAGAVILGKTNTPELAASIGTSSPMFPAAQNPWRSGYTPGGSSGGSAVAVAAGMATVALGDDMGGSIRIPSSCCGVVGLRPTPGRVPQEVPDPTRLNSRGPIACTVADVREALAVITQERPAPASHNPRRIGVILSGPFGVDPACRDACERAMHGLQTLGHTCVTLDFNPGSIPEDYAVVRRVTLGAVPGDPPEYGPGVRGLIAEGRDIRAVEYFQAHRRAVATASRLAYWVEQDFDAILTPTLGSPPMRISEVPPFLGAEWKRYTGFVLPVSFSGLPAVSVPAGLHDGLPIGVQLAGRARGEWELLDLAEELEGLDGFGFQRPPTG